MLESGVGTKGRGSQEGVMGRTSLFATRFSLVRCPRHWEFRWFVVGEKPHICQPKADMGHGICGPPAEGREPFDSLRSLRAGSGAAGSVSRESLPGSPATAYGFLGLEKLLEPPALNGAAGFEFCSVSREGLTRAARRQDFT